MERGPPTERRLLPRSSPEEVRAKGLAYIDGLGDTPRPNGCARCSWPTWAARASTQVMATTGCSRGAVSGYLNEIEREIGVR